MLALQQESPLYEEYIVFGKSVTEVRDSFSKLLELQLIDLDSIQTFSPKYQKAFYQNRLTYKLRKSNRNLVLVFDIKRNAMATSIEVDSVEAKHIIIALTKKTERMSGSNAVMWKWGNNGYVALSRKPGRTMSELYYGRGEEAEY
jgi:hypothetical protein